MPTSIKINYMTNARWVELMESSNDQQAALTDDELKRGWHWCCDWDGLLVGPGMTEQEGCCCFADEHYDLDDIPGHR